MPHNIGQFVKDAKRVQELLARERQNVLRLMGVQLLSLSQTDFQKKSRGGAGADGTRWQPLKASTVRAKSRRGKRNERRKKTSSGKRRPAVGRTQIGVDTGLLRASAQPGFAGSDGRGGNVFALTPDSVTVGYGRNYAKYFDAARPLMPDPLPADWQKRLENIVGVQAEKTVKAALEKYK